MIVTTSEFDSRKHALARIREALAGARLIWSGIRGDDSEALADLPELWGCVSIVAPVGNLREEICLETLRGARPDLDRYDVDFDSSESAHTFRRLLLDATARGRCVVLPYRASALLSTLAYATYSTKLCGMDHVRQRSFEHKPWVERSLVARGVRTIPWRYVADEHRDVVNSLLDAGPHVLRASHTSGGVGLVLARDGDELERIWPSQEEGYVAVAPYVPGTPVNFSGCVFATGELRLHPPSVQLIGIDACTSRLFGYCGNDFGALARVCTADELARLDAMGTAVGHWLYEEGYRGAFGVDAIVSDGAPLFAEVNPRFQGSSPLSARIARELDMSDLYMDHLLAMLELPPAGHGMSLGDWSHRQPALSRVVVHNTDSEPRSRAARDADVDARPSRLGHLPQGIPVEPGGILASFTSERTVTETGFALDADAERLARSLQDLFVGDASREAGDRLLEQRHPHPQAKLALPEVRSLGEHVDVRCDLVDSRQRAQDEPFS